jgi:hypothetical protein
LDSTKKRPFLPYKSKSRSRPSQTGFRKSFRALEGPVDADIRAIFAFACNNEYSVSRFGKPPFFPELIEDWFAMRRERPPQVRGGQEHFSCLLGHGARMPVRHAAME